MNREVEIILVEDDEGHVSLVQRNLRRAGILNTIHCFQDGADVLDFLFRKGKPPHRKSGVPYLLVLDIRMPKVDGVEVLRELKQDPELRKIPIIMLTTTDDPREVERCHALGCSHYITKPIDYDTFINAIQQLGLFLMVVEVPKINGEYAAST
ncbi:MAG TPA: response regulator [bacterium]|nr:response regulator [bacterium]